MQIQHRPRFVLIHNSPALKTLEFDKGQAAIVVAAVPAAQLERGAGDTPASTVSAYRSRHPIDPRDVP